MTLNSDPCLMPARVLSEMIASRRLSPVNLVDSFLHVVLVNADVQKCCRERSWYVALFVERNGGTEESAGVGFRQIVEDLASEFLGFPELRKPREPVCRGAFERVDWLICSVLQPMEERQAVHLVAGSASSPAIHRSLAAVHVCPLYPCSRECAGWFLADPAGRSLARRDIAVRTLERFRCCATCALGRPQLSLF